jgi:hypothetical protein
MNVMTSPKEDMICYDTFYCTQFLALTIRWNGSIY